MTYEVTDTLQFEGRLVYKIESNRPEIASNYMYQEDEKIYF
ncbi:MAG: hypothetical protein R2771_03060 [Saprospiraceae bacterium]